MSEIASQEDMYTLSLDELRARALQEATEPQPEVKDQPRDEQGRFVKPEDAEPEPEQEEEVIDVTPAKKLYRRVVDIGDGVDPEIFEAASMEELVDKIADAKKHATRKIREQEAQLRKAKDAEKPREFSQDEEFVFSQELMAKPTQAFAKMFKEMVGMEISTFKSVADRMNAMQDAQTKNEVISTFLTTHPMYEDTQKNSDLMQVAMQGRAFSAEALEKVYLNLQSKGLLDSKQKQTSVVQDTKAEPAPGITEEVAEEVPSQRTKKASGLSMKNRTPVSVKSTEPTEDDMYKMSTEELRERANQQLRNSR